MSTLSEMRSRIADDLDRTDLSTQIDKAINRAIEYYERERFWFNETVGTFSTVANQKSYGSVDGIPSNLGALDVVQVTISGKETPLSGKSYTYISACQGSDVAGIPSEYAYYQKKIYLWLIPNAVYTITLSYQKKYDTLTLDEDTNDFLEEAEDLIEARARVWLYARVIKDIEQAQIAKVEENDAFKSLCIKTENILCANEVQAAYF